VAVALLIEFILLQVKFRPTSFTQTSSPLTHLRRLIKYSSGKFAVQFSIMGRRFFSGGVVFSFEAAKSNSIKIFDCVQLQCRRLQLISVKSVKSSSQFQCHISSAKFLIESLTKSDRTNWNATDWSRSRYYVTASN
jgi:hypothetical protein